ncbi:hypothetical protein [Candidatus Uabimicrobium sp. HlEnr_7]|uniref:hypothetical protein n=1 Tax=Candidatus Uabimicrobium helgolandensis TaxID=3095367 RepID=UPI0035566899
MKSNSNRWIYSIVTFVCLLFIVGCSTTQNKQPQAEENKQDITKEQHQEQPSETTQVAENDQQPQDVVENDNANTEPQEIDGTLSQEATENFKATLEREKLINQKRGFIVKSFLNSAKNYANEGKYADAYQFVIEALNQDPEHREALTLKHMYGKRLGYRPDEIEQQLEEAESVANVKIEQARLEIDNKIIQGKRLFNDGEYGKAIPLFKQAKEILKFMPYYSMDTKGKARQIDYLVQRADEEREKKEEEERIERMAVAEKQAVQEEESRLRTQQEKLGYLFRQANAAFQREKYDIAENICNQIMAIEPENKEAQSLRRVVRETRHEYIAGLNRDRYSEEWKTIFEQVDEASIPSTDILVYPSYETWKEIEKRGSKDNQSSLDQDDPDTRAVKEVLENRAITMNFTEAPLPEVIDFLRTTTGLNIIIAPSVFTEFPEEEALKVEITVKELKLSSILNLILANNDLTYRVNNGVVIISTKTDATEKAVLDLYDVRDLTGKLTDFAGPELDLAEINPNEQSVGVQLQENDEAPESAITEEQLTDLIKSNIDKKSWDENDRSIDARGGTLIIRQSKPVHKKIRNLLEDLRTSTGILVTVEARFIDVTDDFLEDVGVDWRGLGAVAVSGLGEFAEDDVNPENNNNVIAAGEVGVNDTIGAEFRRLDDFIFDATAGDQDGVIGTGSAAGFFGLTGDNVETKQRIENLFNQTLGDGATFRETGGLSLQLAYVDDIELQAILKAVRKKARSNVVNAPLLTLFNTQRGNVTIITQRSFIQDFDVEVATNAVIADPIIGTFQEGVVLDVRPTVSADRKYVTLELQPTLAVNFDIRELQTELGNAAAGAVTIQFPDIELTKIRTTVTIPDGGTLLIGGLAQSRRVDQMSGVPILSDLPLVSFLTSRKGQSTQKLQKLILIKAKIILPEEYEPKAGLRQY